jgi:hypothetical protein
VNTEKYLPSRDILVAVYGIAMKLKEIDPSETSVNYLPTGDFIFSRE